MELESKNKENAKPREKFLWVDPYLKEHTEKFRTLLKGKGWDFAEDIVYADAFLCIETFVSSKNILETFGVKPLIIYRPRETVPELSLEDLSAVSLSSILNSITHICEKLSHLGESVKDTHHDSFYAGLAYIWSRGKIIDPLLDTKLKMGFGYIYFDTVIHALAPKNSLLGRDIFEYLQDAGFLTSTPFEIAHTCPKCESIMLLLRDSCVHCSSPNIKEEVLVHHFSCGYQASESQYIATNESMLNEYFCPKCRKPLRHFGVDYDKPGVIYHCSQCNHDNADTEVVLKCMSCNHKGLANTSKKIPIVSYHITNQGRKAITSGDSNILNVRRLLSERLKLIPFDTFLLILYKILSLRSQNDSIILMIDIQKDMLLKSHAYGTKILVELSKVISRHSRKGDSISLYQGTLFIMFVGSKAEHVNQIIDLKKTDLNHIFSKEIIDLLNFRTIDGAEFLRQVGGV